jgi:hypothetical protein
MRGSEQFSVLLKTTQRQSWKLTVIAQHLTFLTQYTKTGSLTDPDKLVPGAGDSDALTSDFTVGELAPARPFARLAGFLCYPDDPLVIEA